MKICLPLALVCSLCACHPFGRTATPEEAAAAARAGVRRFPVDVGEYTGLSDLTIDRAGHFWAVPERQRVLLRLNLTRENPGLDDAPIPLEGVPDGTDTEAVAWLSDGSFALGTETQVGGRASDDILLAKVDGGIARVTGKISLPYHLWKMRAKANDGIEGVCAAAGKLLASCETTGVTADGNRFAPIGRYDLGTRTWTPFELFLTTHIGKISALSCRQEGEQLEVLAIERHIGTSQLLRFNVPLRGPGGPIHPETLVDFGHVIDAVPNLEGLAWSPQGDIYALSDNDFGIVTGPTQLVVIPRDWR